MAELQLKDLPLARMMFEDGFEEGKAKGLKKGLEKGKQLLVEIILETLQERFSISNEVKKRVQTSLVSLELEELKTGSMKAFKSKDLEEFMAWLDTVQ